jgi:hypothetical protein
MDAIAQLALMTKAKLVFESPGTFLSFPALSPLVYSVDQLTFATDGAMTVQDLAELSEFARVTNIMPSGVVAPLTSDEMLWDVCDEALRTAELASATMSAQDQATYDEAIAYLYGPPAAGAATRTDGPALLAYRQTRDAYIKAQEDYKAQQLTALSSDDPAIAAGWLADEPRLRSVIAELETAWATTGCREQVEAAQQIELAMGARSPGRLWAEWQTALMKVIDTTTDTNLNDVAQTGITPADVFDGEQWPSFTLSGAEISALVAQAPPDLTTIFGTTTGASASDIESLSFEYRSVGLVRSWFRPAMFQARFWRLGPDGGELSDGAKPPTGRCPAYVVGLVFARHIVVKCHAQPAARVGGRLLRDFMVLRPELIARMPAAMLGRSPDTVVRPAPLSTRTALQRPSRNPSPLVRDPRTPSDAAVRVSRRSEDVVVRDHRTSSGADVRDHRRSEDVVLRDHRGSADTVPPASTTPEPETEPTTDVTVLAFICRWTPRCPDPDVSLRWAI